MRRIIKFFVIVTLLVGIWINSHWTVAAAITFIIINVELTQFYLIVKEQNYKAERAKIEWMLFKKAKRLNRDIQNLQNKIKPYAKQQHPTRGKARTDT